MEYNQYKAIISADSLVHLAGIGGVSMSSLALYLRARGVPVQGSDRTESDATRRLSSLGLRVFIGHDERNICDSAMVIRTAAIGDQSPEIAAALRLGIPVAERAEVWGFIMRDYKNAVCVSGTHGKTTVTGMISLIALEAEADPVIMLGGDLPAIGGSLRDGAGELIIAESCEYKNSFLSFCPTAALVLNIDDDHLDFFSDTDDIIASFRQFVGLTPARGAVIVNRDDPNAMRAADASSDRLLTFGMSTDADVYPESITSERGFYRFSVMIRGKKYADARLSVPGKINIPNALAAAAAAIHLGIAGDIFSRGIEKFTGVGRRFEFKKRWRGADVYIDYAHHPNEISACIETARSLQPRRLICVFQPHTYSRTRAFMADFARVLGLGDVKILCPIFAAREAPIEGTSSEILAEMASGGIFAPSLEAAAQILQSETREGDLILIMGAGDVNTLSDLLK